MQFDLQVPFSTPGRSMLKTAMGMLGEYEYDTVYNENDVPAVTWGLYVLFLIINCIIIMNLLVSHVLSHLWRQSPLVRCLPSILMTSICPEFRHRFRSGYSTLYSCIISIIFFVWVKMVDSINRELTVDALSCFSCTEWFGSDSWILGRLTSSIWNVLAWIAGLWFIQGTQESRLYSQVTCCLA